MSKWETKEKRIDDIVNSAVEIFLEKGYEGASMEAIAKRAQISKGGLYHHFSSKDEILYFANEKLNEPIYEYVRIAAENPDAVEGIRFYIQSYVSYWLTHKKELTFFFLTMVKALSSPEMWQVYEDYYDNMTNFIKTLYDRSVSSGQFSKHNTRASAITLVSALDGVLSSLVMSKNTNSDTIIEDFEDRFITSVLDQKVLESTQEEHY
ncbi:TetR/AcrR family transcriptional regulator [Acetobacterium carbinolicum]|jgi:AcrR family transcriptional regulator|uniref:TetR/AcrR family transcriptional regulator n=1 Tax=Acetobacterium TaxID=33951 RepID=UPI000DBEB281|nr:MULTISPECIES: TetR/AcrR family transcriptional regulator [unclassified Acetobacterium]AWW27221.1 TetR/AcrR family transcriptional regulator [Acetobacterium sp. KB-1]MDZ5724420.1 TetR/AcrR family transcriptional regulator [Acetobacterium sp. K1/6]